MLQNRGEMKKLSNIFGYLSKKCGISENGQVLTEYAVMVVMFAFVALILLVLLDAFNEYGWRIINLVGLDYP